jgi:DNA-binding GntR family transcriptional regulator
MNAEPPVSIADRLELELERLILEGEYQPGARINENALAARFDVSRGAVREACRLLQRSGLVNIVPNQGSFVAALSVAEIVNLFDVRACLGRLAGRLAAATVTRTALQEMRDFIDAMDDASRASDAERYISLNIAFHATLYATTGNTKLADLDAQMGKQLRIYRRHGLAFGGGLAVSNVEHRSILAAIERGECERAGDEVERHIENGRDRFIRAMSATGQLVLKDGVTDKPSRRRAKERQ